MKRKADGVDFDTVRFHFAKAGLNALVHNDCQFRFEFFVARHRAHFHVFNRRNHRQRIFHVRELVERNDFAGSVISKCQRRLWSIFTSLPFQIHELLRRRVKRRIALKQLPSAKANLVRHGLRSIGTCDVVDVPGERRGL